MKSLDVAIIGMHTNAEAYPNAHNRVTQLMSADFDVEDLRVGQGLNGMYGKKRGGTVIRFLKLAISNLRVIPAIIRARHKSVAYLPYPGLPTAWLLSFLPKNMRPRIVLDAFISWYDTAVNDRALFSGRSWRARLLHAFERRAYNASAAIIVDTEANASWLSSTFRIPEKRITAIPLAIDESCFKPLPPLQEKQIHNILFIGTLVPLHGIETIMETARILESEPSIRFTVVGDGQCRTLLETKPANVIWKRTWLGSQELLSELAKADLCLGIFGETAKADRVWPFKNYIYAACARPFITGATTEAHRLASRSSRPIFATSACGDHAALADRIKSLLASLEERNALAANGRNFYEQELAGELGRKAIIETIQRTAE